MNKYQAIVLAKNNHSNHKPRKARAAKPTKEVPDEDPLVEVDLNAIDGKPSRKASPLRRGRPRTGHKRFSKDHQQVTAYLPMALYLRTKINLLKNDRMQFSMLVTELLEKWNKEQGQD